MAWEMLTVCPECNDDNKYCHQKVDFMAMMLSKQIALTNRSHFGGIES